MQIKINILYDNNSFILFHNNNILIIVQINHIIIINQSIKNFLLKSPIIMKFKLSNKINL
jgi:hypothetical protein